MELAGYKARMLMKALQVLAFTAGVFANIYFKWSPNPNVGAGIGAGFVIIVSAPFWIYYKIELLIARRRYRRMGKNGPPAQPFNHFV